MARKLEVQYINFYTPGSEAIQYDFAPVRKKTEATLPKPKRKKRAVLRLDPIALVGLMAALVLFISMICGAVQLASVRSRQNEMAQYVQQLQEKNTALRQTYAAGYDLEEIYDIAIAMGMVPVEEAQHITVQLVPEAENDDTSGWEDLWTFLIGLFA